ncbi:MAG: GNAT family N-acetyltransferase [Acidimicrobiales bacterium]
MIVRKASEADEVAVASVLALAFAHDPVWGWAIPDPEARAGFWSFMAQNGIGQDMVRVVDEVKATAVWVPPGSVELDEQAEAALERLCGELLGPGAHRVMDTFGRLDAVHPTEPHHYLSLLATDVAHRGRGLGMALVADELGRIDAAGDAAYLESTNPANLDRYARVGFRARDELELPGGQVVTTMWRDPRT